MRTTDFPFLIIWFRKSLSALCNEGEAMKYNDLKKLKWVLLFLCGVALLAGYSWSKPLSQTASDLSPQIEITSKNLGSGELASYLENNWMNGLNAQNNGIYELFPTTVDEKDLEKLEQQFGMKCDFTSFVNCHYTGSLNYREMAHANFERRNKKWAIDVIVRWKSNKKYVFIMAGNADLDEEDEK